MSRVRTLAALTAVALIIGAPRASAALPDTTAISHRDGLAALASVTAVSIVPGEQGARVVLAVDGDVRTSDFTLESPHRLVIDIAGARLAVPSQAYDRIARSGIRNLRLSQYRADVVRLVLDLDSPREHQLEHADGELRIDVSGSSDFAAWHAGAPATRAVATGAVATDATATAFPKARLASVESAALVTEPQQSQQPRITVTWQDAEIRDVIAGIAAFANRTIVVGKDVSGTVNAEIKDQPWDVALQAVLAAQGLAATEEASGIIVVDSYQNILAKQASEPVTTQLVNINYANAASLVGTVSTLLSKDCPKGAVETANPSAQPAGQAAGTPTCITRGSVTADTATNTLLVTEVESRLPALLRYVRELDVRTPQVALKAKVIAINRTQAEQLGVSYDFGSSAAYFNTLLPRPRPGSTDASQSDPASARVLLGGDAVAAVSNANRKFQQGAALNLLFTTALGNYSITSFLDALRENNLSDIQAEPSIVTLDNRMATILVGQETPIRVIDAGSAGVVGQPARATVQFKESGIILKVTPHITSNRQIRMSVEAEQSQLRVVGGDLGFFFDKNNATTNLLVSDGETAVIGGLTQTQVTRNKSGIPFLVDLPLIGRLFGQTETREEKRDLLILITPHIVDEGEAVRPPSGGSR